MSNNYSQSEIQKINELRKINLEKCKVRDQKEKAKLDSKNKKNEAKFQKLKTNFDSFAKSKNQRLNKVVKSIETKFDQKISTLKQSLSTTKTNEQELKDSKALYNKKKKYYESRIAKNEAKYENLIKKLQYKIDTYALDKQEGQQKIDQLYLDLGQINKRWSLKIASLNVEDTKIKLEKQIKKLEEKKQLQIKTIEKRREVSPGSSFVSNLRNRIADEKSRYIGNYSIDYIFKKISANIRKYSMFYILALILLIFGSLTKFQNITPSNIEVIFRNNTYVLIIGMGMLLVIVGGNIDLSVGQLLSLLGAISVIIYNGVSRTFSNNSSLGGLYLIITLIGTAFIGALIGISQGFLIGYFKIPSFIVTLGGMLIFKGLALFAVPLNNITPEGGSQSAYVRAIIRTIFDVQVGGFYIISFLIFIVSLALIVLFLVYGRNKKIKFGLLVDSGFVFWLKIVVISVFMILLGYAFGKIGVKWYLLYIMILLVIFVFLTQNTVFGRKVYAIGGNKKSAELSGIDVRKTTTLIFMINGIMVAIASIIFTGIVTSATATAGEGFELDVISSVFVGGASMAGGIGTTIGTLIGGFILGFINNGILLLALNVGTQRVVKGVVLVLAVAYDIYANRKIS